MYQHADHVLHWSHAYNGTTSAHAYKHLLRKSVNLRVSRGHVMAVLIIQHTNIKSLHRTTHIYRLKYVLETYTFSQPLLIKNILSLRVKYILYIMGYFLSVVN